MRLLAARGSQGQQQRCTHARTHTLAPQACTLLSVGPACASQPAARDAAAAAALLASPPAAAPLAPQAGLWAYESMAGSEGAERVSHIVSAGFLAAVSLCAAVGFLLYGGRLFLMLQRFPIESRGRQKKLREVGLVTSICAAAFSAR